MSEINPLKPDFAFSFRSIVSAPAGALELKKIFIGGLSLLAALAVYDSLVYLAVAVDGLSVSHFFRAHSVFPFSGLRFVTLPAKGLFGAGVLLGLFVVMHGFLAIGLITIEELRGNRLCSAKEGIRFSLSRWKQTALALGAMALFLLFLLSFNSGLGLVARIPWIGDELYSVLFVIPGFLVALFTVVIALVFVLSFLILPAATAADRIGESFTSIVETFSTFLRQPFRWVGYTVFSVVSAKVCVWILAAFSALALKSFLWFSSLTGGETVAQTFAGGARLLPMRGSLIDFTTNLWPKLQIAGVDIGFDIGRWSKGGSDGFAALLMAIALVIIFVYVWGYGISILATSQTYAYVIIRKLRDDYDVTAEDPMFLENEWINPPLDDNAIDSVMDGDVDSVDNTEETNDNVTDVSNH
ncbi:hypothetical protein JYU19_01730 [bacterium AH-315-J21]|nr:hypothetical protein [bacterium AH-315-J21]